MKRNLTLRALAALAALCLLTGLLPGAGAASVMLADFESSQAGAPFPTAADDRWQDQSAAAGAVSRAVLIAEGNRFLAMTARNGDGARAVDRLVLLSMLEKTHTLEWDLCFSAGTRFTACLRSGGAVRFLLEEDGVPALLVDEMARTDRMDTVRAARALTPGRWYTVKVEQTTTDTQLTVYDKADGSAAVSLYLSMDPSAYRDLTEEYRLSLETWGAAELRDTSVRTVWLDNLRYTTALYNGSRNALVAPAAPLSDGGLTVTAPAVTARTGSAVRVPLTLAGNGTGLSGAVLSVALPAGLTLTGVENGGALAGLDFTPPGDLTGDTVTMVWSGAEAVAGNGTLATLTFAVPAGAEEGTYPVALFAEYDSFIDQEMQDVNALLRSGSVTVRRVSPGDLNEDGRLNAKDIVLLQRRIVGGYGVTLKTERADLNGDGAVNAKDVVALQRAIAGGYGVTLG